MTRLHTQPVAQATGQAAELFSKIKASIGAVPNAFADIGVNSPNTLATVLAIDAALTRGALTIQDIETVKLVVSEATACDYCLAAHTVISKSAGMSKDTILALRHGRPSGNAKLDALASFVRAVVGTSGSVPVENVNAVKAAGYSDTQIVEILLAASAGLFTNFFNRVNDTVVDFPAAD